MPTKNNKRTYIGGTTSEARKKYFNYDKELAQVVTNLATSYGISPALVIDRLAHEGLIDRAIINNNLVANDNVVDVFGPSLFSESNNKTYNSPYGLLGLDNIYDTYTKGITKTKRPINIKKSSTVNESGELVNSGITNSLYDSLELFTAELASRRNQVKEQYPNLTDAELDSATAARYNATNRYFKQLMESGEYKTKYPIDVQGINIPQPNKNNDKYITNQNINIDFDKTFREAPYKDYVYRNSSYNPNLFLEDGYVVNPNGLIEQRMMQNIINNNFSHPDKVSTYIDWYKCGGRRKAQLGLDIREGGIAIPIANNMFYIEGRKHAAGGVAIGPNNKNGVEVEGGEVVEMIDSNHPSVGRQFKAGGQQQTMRVFSSVPFLRGASPAELVLGGANPNKVFAAQEEFKDKNRINDDGTRYEMGGDKVIHINNLPSSFKGQLRNGRYVQIGIPPVTSKAKSWNTTFKDHVNSLNVEMKDFIMDGINYGKKLLPKPLKKYYSRAINILNSPGVQDVNNTAQKITQVTSMFDEKKAGGIYIKPSKRGTFTAAATKHGMGVQEFASKVLANKEDYSPAMVKKANFARNASRWKKEYGGDMLYTINGNVKNGLSLRPKAEWGKGKDEKKTKNSNIRYLWTPEGLIFENGQSALNLNGEVTLNSDPEFMDIAIKNQSNKRPQFYAEKRMPMFGEQLLAEKFGLARSGWSHGEAPKIDYVPNINISIPTNYASNKSNSNKDSSKSTKPASTSTVEQPAIVRRDEYYSSPKVEGPATPVDEAYAARQARGTQAVKEALTYPKGAKTNEIDEPLIGKFKPFTLTDAISGLSNMIGSTASYFINRNLIDKYPMPTKPIMTPVVKLKTRFDVSGDIADIEESRRIAADAYKRNTSSSAAYLSRLQSGLNTAYRQKAEARRYGERMTNQLINADLQNRQNVYARNVAIQNDYYNRLVGTRQAKSQLEMQNLNNLISGLTGGVTSIMSNIDTRANYNKMAQAIQAANPNVDPRLLGIYDYYEGKNTGKKYNKRGQLIN